MHVKTLVWRNPGSRNPIETYIKLMIWHQTSTFHTFQWCLGDVGFGSPIETHRQLMLWYPIAIFHTFQLCLGDAGFGNLIETNETNWKQGVFLIRKSDFIIANNHLRETDWNRGSFCNNVSVAWNWFGRGSSWEIQCCHVNNPPVSIVFWGGISGNRIETHKN